MEDRYEMFAFSGMDDSTEYEYYVLDNIENRVLGRKLSQEQATELMNKLKDGDNADTEE